MGPNNPLPPPSGLLGDLQNSYSSVQRRLAGIDDQEMKEREDAAQAYAGENEKHFVDFGMDCIKTSVDSFRDMRKIQADCWRTFKEKEPAPYANKARWQSRVVVPKPFASVMYGVSAIKKAFTPDF